MSLPDIKKEIHKLRHEEGMTLQEIANKYENVISLGIGGSYLGIKASQDALCPAYYNDFTPLKKKKPRIYFEGNNLDPDTLSVLLKNLKPKKTFVVVISKSGETTETKSAFMVLEDDIVFTLRGLYKFQPKEYFVIVDMGAVGFVTKCADVMTPGIVDADECIQEHDYVWVCDEKHKKPLAVGMALITGEEMKGKKTCKAIKNIHFVGDRLWNLSAV